MLSNRCVFWSADADPQSIFGRCNALWPGLQAPACVACVSQQYAAPERAYEQLSSALPIQNEDVEVCLATGRC